MNRRLNLFIRIDQQNSKRKKNRLSVKKIFINLAKNSIMHYQKFFSALVHLLYSASKSDKKVHLIEVQEILNIIHADIPSIFPEIPLGFQSLNSSLALSEFETLYDSSLNEMDAYNTFIHFFRANKLEFRSDIRQLCFRLSERVVNAQGGKNSDEIDFLQRLKTDLELDTFIPIQ
ncbi:MAG TPA: hypothetical protein DCG69_05735 [Bacteroidales bacterium]|nr:hypothetical protein [Bacteroidales bacterium]